MNFAESLISPWFRSVAGDFLKGAMVQAVIGCTVGALACTSAEADEFVTPHKPDLPHRELVFPLEAIVRRVSGGDLKIIEAYRYLEHADPHLGDLVFLRHGEDKWTVYWRFGSGKRVVSGHCRVEELEPELRKEVETLLALLKTDATWTAPKPSDGTRLVGGVVQMAAHFAEQKLRVSQVTRPAGSEEHPNEPLQKASLVAASLWQNLAKND